MVWLVIFVALLIPLTAVILDSPVVRSWVDRRHGGDLPAPRDVRELAQKVNVLEAELEAVNRELAQVKEAQEYTQRLLEDPEKKRKASEAKLPRPTD